MKTFPQWKKLAPKGRVFTAQDRSAYGYKRKGQKDFTRIMRTACYYNMFDKLGSDTLLIPAISHKHNEGPAPRVFKNMLTAFRNHGYFPPEAEFLWDDAQEYWAVLLPANSCTTNMMKLASFTYRYMECQRTLAMYIAYKQWLAMKRSGTTLWQCVHWALTHEGCAAGHGIYHFNGPFSHFPVLSLAFAVFGKTPKADHRKAPFNEYNLTVALDQLTVQYMGGRKKMTNVPLDGLLSPKLGKLLQDPLNVDKALFLKTMDSLKGAKKKDRGRLNAYYY